MATIIKNWPATYETELSGILAYSGYVIPDNIKQFAKQQWTNAVQKIDNMTGNSIYEKWSTLSEQNKNNIAYAFSTLFTYYIQLNQQFLPGGSFSSSQGGVSQTQAFTNYPDYVPPNVKHYLTVAGVFKGAKTVDFDTLMFSNNDGSVYNNYLQTYGNKPISSKTAYQLFLQKESITSKNGSVEIKTGTSQNYPTVDLSVLKADVKYDGKTIKENANKELEAIGLIDATNQAISGVKIVADINQNKTSTTTNKTSITTLDAKLKSDFVEDTNFIGGSNVTLTRGTTAGKPTIEINATGGGHTTPPDDVSIKVKSSKLSTVAVYDETDMSQQPITGATLKSANALARSAIPYNKLFVKSGYTKYARFDHSTFTTDQSVKLDFSGLDGLLGTKQINNVLAPLNFNSGALSLNFTPPLYQHSNSLNFQYDNTKALSVGSSGLQVFLNPNNGLEFQNIPTTSDYGLGIKRNSNGGIKADSNGLAINYDAKTLQIINNVLSVKNGGGGGGWTPSASNIVSPLKYEPTGNKIALGIDGTTLKTSSNNLVVNLASDSPVQYYSNSGATGIGLQLLTHSGSATSGLKITANALGINVDNTSIKINGNNQLYAVQSGGSIKIDGNHIVGQLDFKEYANLAEFKTFTLTAHSSGVLGEYELGINYKALGNYLIGSGAVSQGFGGIINGSNDATKQATIQVPTDNNTIYGNKPVSGSAGAYGIGVNPSALIDNTDFQIKSNKIALHDNIKNKLNDNHFNINNVSVNKLLSKTDVYNRSLFTWDYSSNNTIATMDLNGAQLVPKFGNLAGTSSVHKYTLMPLTFGADNPNKKALFGLKVDTDTMEISGSGIEQKLKAKMPVFDTADMEKRAGGWGLKNLHRIKLNNIFSTNNLGATYPLQKSYTSSGNLTTYRLNYASSDFTVNASHELALSSAIKTAINGAKSNYLDVQAGTGIHVAVDRTKTPHEATIGLSTQFQHTHNLFNTNIIKKSNITAGSNYMSVAKGGSSISDNTLSYDLSASTKSTLTKVGTNETNIATQTSRIDTLNTSVTSHITNGVDRTNRFQFDLLLNNAVRHTLTGAFSPLESYITTTPSLLHFHIAYTHGGVRRHFDKAIYTGYFNITGGTAGESSVNNEYYFPLGNWFPSQNNGSSMLVIHYLASSNVWVVAYLGPSLGTTARIVIDRFPSRYNMR